MSVKLRARNHPSLQGRFSVMLLIMEAYEMSQYRSGKCEEWRRLIALLAWTGRARTVEQTMNKLILAAALKLMAPCCCCRR